MVRRTHERIRHERQSQFRDSRSGAGSVIDIVLFPFRLIWGFIVFMVFAWTTSRDGRAFLLAIPAMVFAVVYLAFIWAVGFRGESKARGLSFVRYTKAKDPLEAAYNPDAALLYARKMVDLSPDDPYFKYELALSYERIEDGDKALELMQWLSPEADEGTGFSLSHYWLSGHYLEDEDIDLDEDVRKIKSKQHMEKAYEADTKNVFAVLGLAGIIRDEGIELNRQAETLLEQGDEVAGNRKKAEAVNRLSDAMKLFNEGISLPLITDRQLYAWLAVVEIFQTLGRETEARNAAQQFVTKHENNAIRNPDVLAFWICIVRSCIMTGEFDLGERQITKGYQLAKDPKVRQTLARLAAQIEVEKSKSFMDMDDPQQFVNRLYALSDAIRTDFRVPLAYSELLYFVDGFDLESDQDLWLRDSVLGTGDASTRLDPRVPGVIHIVLGLREIIDGKKEDGMKHWEVAGQQFQLAPFAIDFLIQVLSQERELEAAKTVELLGTAIEMFPQSPHFYASRGRIYQKEGQFEQAVKDLEFAANRIPQGRTIFVDLIECLKELGKTEKIDQFQARIDAIDEAAADKEMNSLSSFTTSN